MTAHQVKVKDDRISEDNNTRASQLWLSMLLSRSPSMKGEQHGGLHLTALTSQRMDRTTLVLETLVSIVVPLTTGDGCVRSLQDTWFHSSACSPGTIG